MYFKFKCPHCEKSLKVREELAGRKCACPYCKGSVRIPQTIATEPPEEESPKPGFPGIDTSVAPKGKGGKPPAKDSKPSATRKPAPSKPAATAAAGGAADSTDVSLVRSGLIGSALSVAFYIFLGLLWVLWSAVQGTPERPKSADADKYAATSSAETAETTEAPGAKEPPYLIAVFACRGWVPFVLVFLTNWSFAILYLKYRKIARQKASMLLDVLPTELSDEITLDSLDKFASHIHGLPGEAGESFLVNRVIRGLEHFRVRRSAAETVTMMESQSEIDANNVASSYTIVKVFIWALPIMGFIGTVIGVSGAVAGLAGSLESSSDISAVKDSLKAVFGNLGVAFDTTLLALVLSLFVKIPSSAMQKSEEDVVTWVDEYCNENLLKRLNDGRQGAAERGAAGVDTSAFREAVETAMAAHQAELESWAKKLESIGSKVTTEVTEGWKEINTQIQNQMSEHGAQLQKQQEQHAEKLLKDYEQRLDELQKKQEEQGQLASQIQEALAGLGDRAASIQNDMANSINGTGEALKDHFAGLERGLSSLSGVLERLGEQQVVVQQVGKPKRGWFSRRSNRRR